MPLCKPWLNKTDFISDLLIEFRFGSPCANKHAVINGGLVS